MRILCLCNDTLSGCELRCVRGWSFAWFSVVKACEAAPAASKIVNFKRQCKSQCQVEEVSKITFSISSAKRTFAELRAWTRNRFLRFLQLRQPQLKQIDQIDQIELSRAARFSTKLPSPWLAQLTDSFGKSFGIQNSQRPGICRSSAIP